MCRLQWDGIYSLILTHLTHFFHLNYTRLPLLKAMKALYDLAVGHRVSWRDATPKAETLSEPLAALLDRMLEPDPLKRATLQQVAESQWANLPLPRKLEVRGGAGWQQC